MLTRQCAWCKKELGEKDGGEQNGITHTICDSCKEKLLDDACREPRKDLESKIERGQ